MKPMKRLLAIAMTAMTALSMSLTTACGSGDQSTGPTASASVRGTWEAISNGATMRMTLSQSGDDVTGNGTVTAGGESGPFTVLGTFVSPDLSLTITDGQDVLNFTGTLSSARTQLRGTLSGPGFSGAIAFDKQ